MPNTDENTVTVENLKTGELMDFTVKHETADSRWTTDAMNAAAAHWQETEINLYIRSWVYGDPERRKRSERRAAEKMVRYIQLTRTWSEAAQIIAAALENGTGEDRKAARAEVFRMAAILDDLKAAQDAAETTGEPEGAA